MRDSVDRAQIDFGTQEVYTPWCMSKVQENETTTLTWHCFPTNTSIIPTQKKCSYEFEKSIFKLEKPNWVPKTRSIEGAFCTPRSLDPGFYLSKPTQVSCFLKFNLGMCVYIYSSLYHTFVFYSTWKGAVDIRVMYCKGVLIEKKMIVMNIRINRLHLWNSPHLPCTLKPWPLAHSGVEHIPSGLYLSIHP